MIAEVGGLVAAEAKERTESRSEIWNTVFDFIFIFFSFFTVTSFLFSSGVSDGVDSPSRSDLYTTDWSESIHNRTAERAPSLSSRNSSGFSSSCW